MSHMDKNIKMKQGSITITRQRQPTQTHPIAVPAGISSYHPPTWMTSSSETHLFPPTVQSSTWPVAIPSRAWKIHSPPAAAAAVVVVPPLL